MRTTDDVFLRKNISSKQVSLWLPYSLLGLTDDAENKTPINGIGNFVHNSQAEKTRKNEGRGRCFEFESCPLLLSDAFISAEGSSGFGTRRR